MPEERSITEWLQYHFTTDEMAGIAKRLATANQEVQDLNQKKAEIAAEFKARITAVETLVSKEARAYNYGYEYRDVGCRVELHVPSQGMKRISRVDTGEVVREMKMTADELQEKFDFKVTVSTAREWPRPDEMGIYDPTESGAAILKYKSEKSHAEICTLETEAGFVSGYLVSIGGEHSEGLPLKDENACLSETAAREKAAQAVFKFAQLIYAEASGSLKKECRKLLDWVGPYVGKPEDSSAV